MIFIWGSRYLTSTRDSGRFYCPHCVKLDVDYRRVAARQWFTMYFIPVFPIGGHEEHIECQRCQGTFKVEVLDLMPPTPEAIYFGDCFERLKRGRSLESMEAELIESGRTTDRAVEVIDAMSNGKVWDCERCGSHYLNCVRKCRDCEGLRKVPGGNIQL